MAIVVELLERLLKPKSLTLGAGGVENPLRKEELYAALNAAASKHTLGLNALLMMHFSDSEATQRVAKSLLLYAKDQGMNFHEPKVSIAVCCVASIPLQVQIRKIKSLHKRYGPRAFRSTKLIATWEKRISSLENSGRHEHLISRHKEDIEREKQSLDRWAENKAKLSTICPKCKGTGIVTSGPCSSCLGAGKIEPSRKDMEKELLASGIISSKLNLTWYAEIINLMNIIHIAQNEAVQEMKQRYELESI